MKEKSRLFFVTNSLALLAYEWHEDIRIASNTNFLVPVICILCPIRPDEAIVRERLEHLEAKLTTGGVAGVDCCRVEGSMRGIRASHGGQLVAVWFSYGFTYVFSAYFRGDFVVYKARYYVVSPHVAFAKDVNLFATHFV